MKAVAVAFALLVPSVAFASSDDAWADLAKKAAAACTASIKRNDANLKTVSVAGTVLGIGGADGDQFYGLVLKGKAKAYEAQFMCLYDKRTKAVSASEIAS